MMAWILLALGLVMIVEGLAYALAPSLIEEMLQLLRNLPLETRRQTHVTAPASVDLEPPKGLGLGFSLG